MLNTVRRQKHDGGVLGVQWKPDWGGTNPFLAGEPGLSRTSSDPRVVISLTTVPAGVHGLGPTLISLKNQTFKPDAIDLNLPHISRRGLGVYPKLSEEDAEGIFVHHTDDWFALTNLVPTVQREAGRKTLIIVVDDDKVYPPSLVEDHVRAHRNRPHSAHTCRGYKIPTGGELFPTWSELRHSWYGHQLQNPQQVAIVTGSDSWSAPVSAFTEALWKDLNRTAPNENGTIESYGCLMNDIWVSGQLSRHNISKFVTRCQREARDVPKSMQRARQNLSGNRWKLNQMVMQFYLHDWLPSEMLSLEELITPPRQFVPEVFMVPPPPSLLTWFRSMVVSGVRSLVLGS